MLLPTMLSWQLQFVQQKATLLNSIITTFSIMSVRRVPLDFLLINQYLLYILDTEMGYLIGDKGQPYVNDYVIEERGP